MTDHLKNIEDVSNFLRTDVIHSLMDVAENRMLMTGRDCLIMANTVLMVARTLEAKSGRLEDVLAEWEALSEADPDDPCNPGGYAADVRAALSGD